MFTKLSEHFEFRHFRPHYLDVDTIFGDLRRECSERKKTWIFILWELHSIILVGDKNLL